MKKRILATVLATGCCLSAAFSFSGCDLFSNTAADYEKWSASIAETALLSNVNIKKHETPFQGNTQISQGSGMIFHTETIEGEVYYYALTNNHVIHEKITSLGSSYAVYAYDCFDNVYTSSVVYADAAYDLAVISFSQGTDVEGNPILLNVANIAESNPSGATPVAAVGNPEGRHNSSTFGKTIRYETVSVTGVTAAESNVAFPALVHSAFTLSGSSGCAVIDEKLEIVGVHYACGYDQDGEFVEGYAVPALKIREFLLAAEEKKGIELGV
ncbi:MAG: trypsin-like peptidase domain-containing protein [Clostridia bacterium]|nr:trypsin-like peptidase domain-containing protein [Clostridia bacterium]